MLSSSTNVHKYCPYFRNVSNKTDTIKTPDKGSDKKRKQSEEVKKSNSKSPKVIIIFSS